MPPDRCKRTRIAVGARSLLTTTGRLVSRRARARNPRRLDARSGGRPRIFGVSRELRGRVGNRTAAPPPVRESLPAGRYLSREHIT